MILTCYKEQNDTWDDDDELFVAPYNKTTI